MVETRMKKPLTGNDVQLSVIDDIFERDMREK